MADNLSDLETRMQEVHKGDVAKHLKEITDPKQRAEAAMDLHMYRNHSPLARAELEEQLPGAYTELYQNVVKHVEDRHKSKGRVGLHKSVVGDASDDDRKVWAEDLVDEVLKYILTKRKGPKLAGQAFADKADDSDLTPEQKRLVKEDRKNMINQFLQDEHGYDKLVRSFKSSKNIIHDVQDESNPLYKSLQNLAVHSTDYAIKGLEVDSVVDDAYLGKPELVSTTGVDTVNKWMTAKGHNYGLNPMHTVDLKTLKARSQIYTLSHDALKEAATESDDKHLYTDLKPKD